jgi:ATP phosphoribosyltransferase regulatory subunit HisZ
MLSSEPASPAAATSPHAKKALADLDDLVQAVLKALPGNKPWQRHLRSHFSEADRQLQILRLVQSLGKPSEEEAAAVACIFQQLKAAYAYVNGGRADMGTRAAVLLAYELARSLNTEFCARTP